MAPWNSAGRVAKGAGYYSRSPAEESELPMTPHKALPLPPWSLLADGLAAAMLAVGLLVLFSPG